MSLLRDNDAFRSLWSANVASQLGVRVGALVVPLVAIETLHASPFAIGALNAVQYVGLLLIGLPAGVWVDRMRRRPIMFVADAARAILFGSVAAMGLLGWLSYPQLLAVVLLGGFATVFFDVAQLSLLPGLVAPGELLEGNARIQAAQSVALIAGPAIGGVLVSAIGTSGAVWVTAAGFALSGLQIVRIRTVETPSGRADGASLLQQIAEGLRLVFGQPVLRGIALCTAWSNLFQSMFISLNLLLLTRILGLSGAVVGLLIACSGIGAVLGALAGHRVARRIGRARTAWLALAAHPAADVAGADHRARLAMRLLRRRNGRGQLRRDDLQHRPGHAAPVDVPARIARPDERIQPGRGVLDPADRKPRGGRHRRIHRRTRNTLDRSHRGLAIQRLAAGLATAPNPGRSRPAATGSAGGVCCPVSQVVHARSLTGRIVTRRFKALVVLQIGSRHLGSSARLPISSEGGFPDGSQRPRPQRGCSVQGSSSHHEVQLNRSVSSGSRAGSPLAPSRTGERLHDPASDAATWCARSNSARVSSSPDSNRHVPIGVVAKSRPSIRWNSATTPG